MRQNSKFCIYHGRGNHCTTGRNPPHLFKAKNIRPTHFYCLNSLQLFAHLDELLDPHQTDLFQ